MNCVRPGRNRGGRRSNAGDLPFLIRRDGSWLYRGSPIGRKELVCLFASVLKREADGSFWLETPAERGRIEVEDAPFVAVELDWTGDGRHQILSFRTNVDQVVTAGPDHPIRVAHDLLTCEPTPYIRGASGRGELAGRSPAQSRRLLRTGRAGGPGVGRLPPHAGRLELAAGSSPGRDAERRGITTPAKGSDESGPSGLARPPEGENERAKRAIAHPEIRPPALPLPTRSQRPYAPTMGSIWLTVLSSPPPSWCRSFSARLPACC